MVGVGVAGKVASVTVGIGVDVATIGVRVGALVAPEVIGCSNGGGPQVARTKDSREMIIGVFTFDPPRAIENSIRSYAVKEEKTIISLF